MHLTPAHDSRIIQRLPLFRSSFLATVALETVELTRRPISKAMCAYVHVRLQLAGIVQRDAGL